MGRSWVISLVAAAVVTATVTPFLRRFALRIGLVDNPSARKVHKAPVPYLGGLAIAMGVLAGLSLGPGLGWRLEAVALVAASLCGLGLLDDCRQLPASTRFAVEIGAALVTVALGFGFDVTGLAALDGCLTVIWIVGLTNAANLLDNMDGLAAGTAASIACGALILTGGDGAVAGPAACVAGACCGFLAYNKRPASIYMGDAGSLLLGYLVSVITLSSSSELGLPAALFVPLMLAAIPVADTTTVVLARVRRGISPAQAGKDHLSHRLVRRGLSQGRAVLAIVGVSAVSSVAAALAGRELAPMILMALAGVVPLALLLLVALPVQVYGSANERAPLTVVGRTRSPMVAPPPSSQTQDLAS